jgi:hypothetical protein
MVVPPGVICGERIVALDDDSLLVVAETPEDEKPPYIVSIREAGQSVR